MRNNQVIQVCLKFKYCVCPTDNQIHLGVCVWVQASWTEGNPPVVVDGLSV